MEIQLNYEDSRAIKVRCLKGGKNGVQGLLCFQAFIVMPLDPPEYVIFMKILMPFFVIFRCLYFPSEYFPQTVFLISNMPRAENGKRKYLMKYDITYVMEHRCPICCLFKW